MEVIELLKRAILERLGEVKEEDERLRRVVRELSPPPPPPRIERRARLAPGERGQRMRTELAKGPGTVPELTKRVGLDPRSTALYPEAKHLLDKKVVVKNGAVYELVKPTTAPAKKASTTSAKKQSSRSTAARKKSGGGSRSKAVGKKSAKAAGKKSS